MLNSEYVISPLQNVDELAEGILEYFWGSLRIGRGDGKYIWNG